MSPSRRDVLKLAAAGTLVASTAKAGGGGHFAGYPGRLGILHDATLCVGCRRCEAGCADVNREEYGLEPLSPPLDDPQVFDAKRRTGASKGRDREGYTVVNRYLAAEPGQPPTYRKHQCMHCNEPCCASVCFVKAFTKTPEGPVLYDPEVCVGCRYCLVACPYHALAYEYEDPLKARVVRCTMCYPRIKQGKQPGCVERCPMGALVFGEREQLIRLAHERIRKQPGDYVDHIFGEHEWGGTSWLLIAGKPFEELGLFDPDKMGPEPIPALSTGFLSMAPLVAALFPGLLAGFYAFTKRKDKLGEEELRKVRKEERERADEQLKNQRQQQERLAAVQERQAVRQALRQAGVDPDAAAPAPNQDPKPEPKKESQS